MRNSNWAEWSIKHKQLVYFFAVLVLVMGIFSFRNLGRSEDPSFTVKQMVISAAWPGASAKQVEMHLTDEIEKQVQTCPTLTKLPATPVPELPLSPLTLKMKLKGTRCASTGWNCVTL